MSSNIKPMQRPSTIPSHHATQSFSMPKPCEASGQPSCIKGFVREKCRKCDMGSVQCEMCHPSQYCQNHPPTQPALSPRASLSMDRTSSTSTPTCNDKHHATQRGHSSPALMEVSSSSSSFTSSFSSQNANSAKGSAPSPSCIFCYDGRKPCDECFGLGYVQRVCQECIKDQHRRNHGKRRSTGSSIVYGSAYAHYQQSHQPQQGHVRQLSRESIQSTMPSILTSQQWKRWLGLCSSPQASSFQWRPTRHSSKSCSALDLEQRPQQQQQQQQQQHQQQVPAPQSQEKDKPASRRHSSVSSASSTMSLSSSTQTSRSSCPPAPVSPVESQQLPSEDLAQLADDQLPSSLSQHEQQSRLEHKTTSSNTKAWKRWMSTLKIKSRPVLFRARSLHLAAPVMSAA
ncbi:hypothetical protein BGZ73_002343 [Actinomortierella ambigua]|nr:hypothetical protein BGZ73_002343 [Actinomortierella ambigua]